LYHPTEYLKNFDKKGNFIRKYVPELKNFPEELIYEPWRATLKEQSKARCMIGVDYPSRIVTETDLKTIFTKAKTLLKKSYHFYDDIQIQKFEDVQRPRSIQNPKQKFKIMSLCSIKVKEKPMKTLCKNESTKMETIRDGMSQEIVSQERVQYRDIMEEYQINPDRLLGDPREDVILLKSKSKPEVQCIEKSIRNFPKYLVEKRVAGKKELTKDSQLEVIHYKYKDRTPQVAMHSIYQKNGKISFIDKCTVLENEKIIVEKEMMIQSQGLSCTQTNIKASIDQIIHLNDKLLKMADIDRLDSVKSVTQTSPPKRCHLANLSVSKGSSDNQPQSAFSLNNSSEHQILRKSNPSSSMKLKSGNHCSVNEESTRAKVVRINPLEISTMKSTNQGKHVVICHIKVHPDEVTKPMNINISNEGHQKKILVISHSTPSQTPPRHTPLSTTNQPNNVSSLATHPKSKADFKPKTSSSKGVKVMDTNEFFKKVMLENEKIVQANQYTPGFKSSRVLKKRPSRDADGPSQHTPPPHLKNISKLKKRKL
jgi:hypothetical protein